MTINIRLLGRGGEEELHVFPSPVTKEPVLMSMSPSQAHSHFKTATLTTANTSIVIQPKPGLSIWISDIIISGEKQAGSDITVQFNDGTNAEIIVIINQVDSSPNLSVNLNSYFRGWKDARVEMITSGAGDATVTVGYIHSVDSPTFSEWDSDR